MRGEKLLFLYLMSISHRELGLFSVSLLCIYVMLCLWELWQLTPPFFHHYLSWLMENQQVGWCDLACQIMPAYRVSHSMSRSSMQGWLLCGWIWHMLVPYHSFFPEGQKSWAPPVHNVFFLFTYTCDLLCKFQLFLIVVITACHFYFVWNCVSCCFSCYL